MSEITLTRPNSKESKKTVEKEKVEKRVEEPLPKKSMMQEENKPIKDRTSKIIEQPLSESKIDVVQKQGYNTLSKMLLEADQQVVTQPSLYSDLQSEKNGEAADTLSSDDELITQKNTNDTYVPYSEMLPKGYLETSPPEFTPLELKGIKPGNLEDIMDTEDKVRTVVVDEENTLKELLERNDFSPEYLEELILPSDISPEDLEKIFEKYVNINSIKFNNGQISDYGILKLIQENIENNKIRELFIPDILQLSATKASDYAKLETFRTNEELNNDNTKEKIFEFKVYSDVKKLLEKPEFSPEIIEEIVLSFDIRAEDLKEIFKKCKNINTIKCDKMQILDSDVLFLIGQNKNIKELFLFEISEKDIPSISHIDNLNIETIKIDADVFSKKEINDKIKQIYEKAEDIKIVSTSFNSDEEFKSILDCFPKLNNLDLSEFNSIFSLNDLKYRGVKNLYLASVTSDQIKELSEFTHLEQLVVKEVRDVNISSLKNIKKITISTFVITKEVNEIVKNIEKNEHLGFNVKELKIMGRLANSETNAKNLSKLGKALPNIKSLDLGGIYFSVPLVVTFFNENFKNLENLRVFTDGLRVDDFKKFEYLKSLSIRSDQHFDSQTMKSFSEIKKLEFIRFEGCKNIKAPGFFSRFWDVYQPLLDKKISVSVKSPKGKVSSKIFIK